jgi:hypothetical protein
MIQSLLIIIAFFISSSIQVKVEVWATNVNVRTCPSTECNPPITQIDAGKYDAECQMQGEQVTASGYTNSYWTKLLKIGSGIVEGGWITNIYIKGDSIIDGVPMCGDQPTEIAGQVSTLSAPSSGTNATEADEDEIVGAGEESTSEEETLPEDMEALLYELTEEEELALDNETTVYVWGSGVNVRSCAGTSCDPPIGNITEPGFYNAICQDTGEQVSAEEQVSNLWTKVTNITGMNGEGWVSNIYIENADIPFCNETGAFNETDNETDTEFSTLAAAKKWKIKIWFKSFIPGNVKGAKSVGGHKVI